MMEVYVRMTCTNMKPSASVFRLKRNYKNLSSKEYGDNLVSYLNNTRSCKNISIDDLNNVLIGLSGGKEVSEEDEEACGSSSSDLPICVGTHVTVFWLEKKICVVSWRCRSALPKWRCKNILPPRN